MSAWRSKQFPWVYGGAVHYMPFGWLTSCDLMCLPEVGPKMWDVE